MPSMRRELDVWYGRGHPFSWPLDADDVASNLRNFNFELPALRREPAGHHSHRRLPGTGGRGIFGSDESWWNQWRCLTEARRVRAMAFRSIPAMAVDHGDISSRQPSAHRLQHVGADGYRSANRGTLRLGAISFHLRPHRHRSLSS